MPVGSNPTQCSSFFFEKRGCSGVFSIVCLCLVYYVVDTQVYNHLKIGNDMLSGRLNWLYNTPDVIWNTCIF